MIEAILQFFEWNYMISLIDCFDMIIDEVNYLFAITSDELFINAQTKICKLI